MRSENGGSLPAGWTKTTLETVCEISAGNPAPQGDQYFEGGRYSFVRVQDMGRLGGSVHIRNVTDKVNDLAILKLRLFPKGSVLFTKSGASTLNNQRALLSEDAYVVSHIGVAIPHLGVLSEWVYYFLKCIDFGDLAHSSVMPSLPLSKITQLSISIPPFKEQHRIVAKIEELFSELDKGIENLKTAQAQLKVYRQALLKHAFEGKLTAQWRADNPDKLETADALLKRIQKEREQRYQQQVAEWEASGKKGTKPKPSNDIRAVTDEELNELPSLPPSWLYIRAEEICGFITKGTTPSKDLLFAGTGAVPFIKVYNLTKTGFLDFSIEPTFVSEDTHNGFLARSKVYPNDVLMNIVGPPLGKVSIVPNTYSEWNINQAIAIYRSKQLSPKFLAAYLASEPAVRSMMKKSKATAGQFNLTLEICRDVPLPLCGKPEQEEIELLLEEKLSGVDQIEQTIVTALIQSEALRQSILKKAFSGQLVPQDPTDESASALLARIKAEQSAAPKAKKARK